MSKPYIKFKTFICSKSPPPTQFETGTVRSGKPEVLFVVVGALRQRRTVENRYFLVCTGKCVCVYTVTATLSSLVLQAHAILCRSAASD